jgi:hypothetical protein
MLIYEVNLTVDGSVAPHYSAWLREHIREILLLDGFEAAAWYVRSDDAATIPDGDDVEDPRQWTIHYQVRDREALQAYFDDHAERLRQEGADEFGDHATAERRILQHQRLFHGQRMEDTGPM